MGPVFVVESASHLLGGPDALLGLCGGALARAVALLAEAEQGVDSDRPGATLALHRAGLEPSEGGRSGDCKGGIGDTLRAGSSAIEGLRAPHGGAEGTVNPN